MQLKSGKLCSQLKFRQASLIGSTGLPYGLLSAKLHKGSMIKIKVVYSAEIY